MIGLNSHTLIPKVMNSPDRKSTGPSLRNALHLMAGLALAGGAVDQKFNNGEMTADVADKITHVLVSDAHAGAGDYVCTTDVDTFFGSDVAGAGSGYGNVWTVTGELGDHDGKVAMSYDSTGSGTELPNTLKISTDGGRTWSTPSYSLATNPMAFSNLPGTGEWLIVDADDGARAVATGVETASPTVLQYYYTGASAGGGLDDADTDGDGVSDNYATVWDGSSFVPGILEGTYAESTVAFDRPSYTEMHFNWRTDMNTSVGDGNGLAAYTDDATDDLHLVDDPSGSGENDVNMGFGGGTIPHNFMPARLIDTDGDGVDDLSVGDSFVTQDYDGGTFQMMLCEDVGTRIALPSSGGDTGVEDTGSGDTGTDTGSGDSGDTAEETVDDDLDDDGVLSDEDCDDSDSSVGAPGTYYQDADGDGAGNIDVSVEACEQPEGYVANASDCNDRSSLMPDSDGNCDTETEEVADGVLVTPGPDGSMPTVTDLGGDELSIEAEDGSSVRVTVDPSSPYTVYFGGGDTVAEMDGGDVADGGFGAYDGILGDDTANAAPVLPPEAGAVECSNVCDENGQQPDYVYCDVPDGETQKAELSDFHVLAGAVDVQGTNDWEGTDLPVGVTVSTSDRQACEPQVVDPGETGETGEPGTVDSGVPDDTAKPDTHSEIPVPPSDEGCGGCNHGSATPGLIVTGLALGSMILRRRREEEEKVAA